MPTYSSDQFYREWCYAVDKDFVDSAGEPFEYTENGKKTWGDEMKCVKFDVPPSSAAISHKGSFLAIVVNHDIHIFDAKFNPFCVLKGHTSRVDSIAFRPGDAKVLVSCAMNSRVGTVRTDPTIIFWDLNTKSHSDPDLGEDEIADIGWYAARAVTERLTELNPPLKLAYVEQEYLAKQFKPVVSQALARNRVSGNLRIPGRLQSNFQSNIFSPSGKYMMYLPGKAPRSNGDEQWDINIYSVDEQVVILTLTGHRDALMWMGYDNNEALVGTVAWDKTMKIWNASTGELKYTFETNGQNWTGGFSPDSKMFAGTCGDGSIHVYSLDDGAELLSSDFGKRWCRTLAWSPDSSMLAVGGQDFGKMVLIDIKQKQIVQERRLSAVNAKVKHEDMRRIMTSYLEVCNLKFVDGGKKIVYFTTGDGSAEVYDLAIYGKWRFARTGTDSYSSPRTEEAEDETGKVTVRAGSGMEVWEDSENGQVMLATVDGDAVRIWSISGSS